MPRFTKQSLISEYTSSIRYFQDQKIRMINESQSSRPHFDIFLSHSLIDKEVVFGLFVILSRQGYAVYVDWVIDQNLVRNEISKKNAAIIRSRMNQSATLFHATTKNTSTSNWMPWETGYMDAKRDKCAIVEILEDRYTAFQSQEYLLLYPYVTQEENPYRKEIMIVNRDTKNKITFDQWKDGKKP